MQEKKKTRHDRQFFFKLFKFTFLIPYFFIISFLLILKKKNIEIQSNKWKHDNFSFFHYYYFFLYFLDLKVLLQKNKSEIEDYKNAQNTEMRLHSDQSAKTTLNRLISFHFFYFCFFIYKTTLKERNNENVYYKRKSLKKKKL